MLRPQLPLAFFLIIHTLYGNTNASDSEEIDTIDIHLSHTKSAGIRELGYIQLSLFDGKSFSTFPDMNIHSSHLGPRDIATLRKAPPTRDYKPGNYKPKKYKATYQISLSHFIMKSALYLSFFQEQVDLKFFLNPNGNTLERHITMIPWQNWDKIELINLGIVPLKTHDNQSLDHLSIDIIWEGLSKPIITAKAYYEAISSSSSTS